MFRDQPGAQAPAEAPLREPDDLSTFPGGMKHSTRPLSPHLQIYRPQLTSVLSIAHRGTGILLAAGALFLVYWLNALASGPDAFNFLRSLAGTWYGQGVLLGFCFSLFYHLCNGIRHLFWDAGVGFELSTAYRSGRAVVAASLVLTAATWVAAALMGGGA